MKLKVKKSVVSLYRFIQNDMDSGSDFFIAGFAAATFLGLILDSFMLSVICLVLACTFIWRERRSRTKKNAE